jgi:ATP-binding cassette subfamily F protein 3
VDGVSFGYGDGHPLFEDLRFEINDHDRICVIGPNGKGKSTLLRVLAGELEPRTGSITSHPRTVPGYFAQTNVNTLHPKLTVIEEIQSADSSCLPQKARDVAGVMMFEGDDALKKISVLSGGEKSRVMLAKLVVTPSNLLFLDEPTNHLDMDSCDSLLGAIDAFDGAAVIVTHNEMFLHALATKFIIFDRGGVRIFDGSYQDFLDTIGWEMDDSLTRTRTAATPTPEAPPVAVPTAAADRKAARQTRARMVQERARLLGPLERRVAETEKRIMALERDRENTFAALANASASGDAHTIAEMSRKSRELDTRIEAAYEDLEKATLAFERESKSFENKWKEAM